MPHLFHIPFLFLYRALIELYTLEIPALKLKTVEQKTKAAGEEEEIARLNSGKIRPPGEVIFILAVLHEFGVVQSSWIKKSV